MIPKKIRIIATEVFKNQADMAKKLEVGNSRISEAINGKTKYLNGEVIEKLIMTYNIDPVWLFSDDDEPLRFRNTEQAKPEPKYYQAVERINVLQEELLKYQKKDIDSLKNNSDVHV
jgi:transcriptional regulator with XRE-family HTH domain